MRLSELVRLLGGELRGGGVDPELRDVRLDSRQVRAGDLFVALPGTRSDGARFTADAAARGAVAVLTPHEHDHRADTSHGALGAAPARHVLPRWVHPEARRTAALAAAELNGRPQEQVELAGITGTNGKTTTAHLTGQLLERAGRVPAVLGTAGHRLAGGLELPASHTTPDGPELVRLLARHRDAGGRTAVMEVSSHALVQERTAGLTYRVAAFTNLTREHLDYHGDMQAYAQAKARLFDQLAPDGAAVVNADDPAGELMLARARERGARTFTFSTQRSADLRASRLRTDLGGTHFDIDGMGIFSCRARIPLRGRFNVENALAALAVACLMGASPDDAVAGLASTFSAPGRLEPVPTGERGFTLLVDYAHSPDALERVLRALREDLQAQEGAADRRLIVVFGCGGDRDPGKRAPMGALAARLADVVVVTSDNPRSENPARIVDDVLAGVPRNAPGQVLVELDRARAIRTAVSMARPGDVLLVAGKGHETTQTLADRVLPFDDRVVAREALV